MQLWVSRRAKRMAWILVGCSASPNFTAWAQRLTREVNLPFKNLFCHGEHFTAVRLTRLESMRTTQPPRLWKFTWNRDQASLRPSRLAPSRWAPRRGLGSGKLSRAQPFECCMDQMDWMMPNGPTLSGHSLISCKKRPRGRRMATPQNDSRSMGRIST